MRTGTTITTFLAAGAIALASVSGCDDPPKPSGTAQPGSAAPTLGSPAPFTVGPSPDQTVQAALLSATDLPGTWTPSDMGNSPAAQLDTSMDGCANGGAPLDPVASARAAYQGGLAGPLFAEAIAVSTPRESERAMRALDNIARNCGRFEGAMPGGVKLEMTITPLAFPAMADAVVAFRLTATVPNAGAALYAHMVGVRTRNVVVRIVLVQVTSPDEAAAQSIARSAVAKAEKVLGAR